MVRRVDATDVDATSDARGTVVEPVPVGRRQLLLERPASAEALLDEDAFARDEFLPYWAELWPSGVALARHLIALDLEGLRVVELGCGLGLPSLAAALAGADVLATDWSPDALAFAARNAARNGATVRTALLRWEEPSALRHERAFDLALGADVLYEARHAAPLLALLRVALRAGGAALVADPGRRHAAAFLALARRGRWQRETVHDALLPRGGIHRLWREGRAIGTKPSPTRAREQVYAQRGWRRGVAPGEGRPREPERT